MPHRLPLSIALAVSSFAATPEFNRDVRPILSDKCFACHGPGTAAGKVRLDAPSHVVKAGDPAASSLFQRITTDNKVKRMPPAFAGHDKLDAASVETIRKWIEGGAQWEKHWSFIPPKRPQGTIDSLVRTRLAREGLQLANAAEQRTLLRRVTLDLTGLPPTWAESQAFLNDKAPGAYERAVDRLLASPAFAERMAIRWLEAARYSDTNGYQTDGVRDMWRWRDWVIDAFARNMPYDQFTVEQIAGDLLPNATLSQKIATGFHRNHRTTAEGGIIPEEYRTEYVADRAETTATVWLGLTAGCARCHDHKYDPITQKDFYSLFAFFNNVPEKGLVYNWGNDEPMIKAPTPAQQAELAKLDTTLAVAQARWKALNSQPPATWKVPAEWTVTDGLDYRWNDGRHFSGTDKDFVEADRSIANFDYLQPFTFTARIRPEQPNGSILSHDEDHAEASGHGLHLVSGKLRLHVIFRWTDIGLRVETAEPIKLNQWQHVAVTYDGSRYASGVTMYIDGRKQKLNVLFDELNWPMSFRVPFRIGAGSGLRFKGDIADARVYSRALSTEEARVVAGLEEPARARMSWLASAAPAPVRDAQAKLREAQQARDAFYKKIPTVMVMSDAAPRQTYLLKRGAYDAPGEKVDASVPSFLPALPAKAPRNRLTLAKWIVSRENPLTARVTVNRFWQMLFGTGLVKTTEDFGSQGEWPVYQDVLDLLAVDFMDSGWNVRHLLRTIVTSDVYKQSSTVDARLIARDPENRLLARGPRLRLGPDAIRDSALAASGLLVRKVGGPSVKPPQPAGLWQELAGGSGYVADEGEGRYRRSIYTFWRRTIPPPFMVNFDSPNREVCSVKETRTNTPLQALNLMNDPAFLEAAEKLADRTLKQHWSDTERVRYAWRTVLLRDPRDTEEATVLQLVNSFRKRKGELAAWTAATSLLFNLDEAVTKE